MKTRLLTLLILFSTNSWAASQLNCKVNEAVNPPQEAQSEQVQFAVPLSGADMSAPPIDLAETSLGLSLNLETFSSTLTSPGQQVILITVTDNKTGVQTTTDGHGFAEAYYDTDRGTLFVQCSVQ